MRLTSRGEVVNVLLLMVAGAARATSLHRTSQEFVGSRVIFYAFQCLLLIALSFKTYYIPIIHFESEYFLYFVIGFVELE